MRTPACELRRARAAAVVAVLGLLGAVLVTGPGVSAGPLRANGRIVYASDAGGDAEIYTVASDGGAVAQLTDNGAWDTEPAFSPDGSRIAFTSDRSGDDDIWVMNRDGSGAQNLTGAGAGSDYMPDWSPDGLTIAFMRDFVIHTVAADGSSGPVALAEGRSPAWSPDGSKIAFVRPPDTDGDVYTMDPNGSRVAPLSRGLLADSPTWSPDSDTVAVEAVGEDDGNYHVFAVAAGDGAVTQLTDDDSAQDFDPDFSPDGTKLVFTRLLQDADLMVANANGTSAAALTASDAYEFLASWGPCVGSSCPTPTPDPSGTSPTPTPTGTQSPDPRAETSLSLRVAKTKARIVAAGHLDPAEPGDSIAAKLSKLRKGRWKRIASRSATVQGDAYKVSFRRPEGGGRCRIVVRFAGDADRMPSRRSKRIRC